MPRPPEFPTEAILGAAAAIASEQGPPRTTIASIAERLGAPTGSIYHRFSSRDVLLAELWLQTVEAFQTDFCKALAGDDASAAGLDAALHTPRWVRANPVSARLLLLHHRDDFLRGEWPRDLSLRANRLRDEIAGAIRSFARRALGHTSVTAVRRCTFAVIDVPSAAVGAHLRAGEAVPAAVDGLIREAYFAVLPADAAR